MVVGRILHYTNITTYSRTHIFFLFAFLSFSFCVLIHQYVGVVIRFYRYHVSFFPLLNIRSIYVVLSIASHLSFLLVPPPPCLVAGHLGRQFSLLCHSIENPSKQRHLRSA